MKKILIIINSIRKGGGAENVATSIGNKLFEKGYNINYLTFYDFPKNEKIKIFGKYYSLNEKIYNNLLLNIFKLFKRAYYISKYCKKNNINTSISHLDEANFSNILSKIFFGNKSKIIIEIHNSIEKSLNKIYIILYKLIINFSDKVISLTKEDLINYKKFFNIKDEKKLINIYNPINIKKIDKLKKEKITELKINKNDFILINIGRLNKQKNQELLIDAFNKFNSIIKNSKLIILGEGELKNKLKEKVKKINNKNIFFLGKQENPYKFLNQANYLVMSSNYEGLPVVQIESLACNTPIISSNCKTGPKEILTLNNNINHNRNNFTEITDCGILFPTGDEQKLIESLKKAYKLKKDFFIRNLNKKIKEFDINIIIKKWEKIIEE